jgi:hypothetical protein
MTPKNEAIMEVVVAIAGLVLAAIGGVMYNG